MKTNHKIFYQDSRNMSNLPSESVDLMVTCRVHELMS